MKKILICLEIFLGILGVAGFAGAASGIDLQPAANITYNDNLIVNGFGQFKSIRIGEEGVGGVTYFNGTIINIGEKVPVTFGDDVRIDGQIWGGPEKGNASDQALKIADTLLPGLTNINDLGSEDLRWRDLYIDDINLKGNINRKNAVATYLSISGAACSTGRTFPSLGYCDNNLGISYVMSWNVNLPDRVKINEFAGNIYNASSAKDLECNLWRTDHSNPLEVNNLASIIIKISDASANWKWLTDDSVNFETVDNAAYSYHVGCNGAPSADVRAANFRIKYEKTFLD